MFNRILVCLDGSHLAEQILPFVEVYAKTFGSRLVLLQAFDLSTPLSASAVRYASLTPGTLEKSLAEEAKKTQDYLDQITQRLHQRGIEAVTVALHGPAGNVISRYAESQSIDLIAIATHGRSGLGRTIFGSVADFVLRESGLPILVIKPQDPEKVLPVEAHPFKKVLVCLDGSPLAEQILPYAAEQAQRFGSKMILLQAYEISVAESDNVDHNLLRRKERSLRDDAIAYLGKVAEPLTKKGLDVVCVSLRGLADRVIVDYAQNEAVGLIALATHGRSGLGRSIFGSVADSVLRESGLPILLIKPS